MPFRGHIWPRSLATCPGPVVYHGRAKSVGQGQPRHRAGCLPKTLKFTRCGSPVEIALGNICMWVHKRQRCKKSRQEISMPDSNVADTAVKAKADDAKTYWLSEGWAPGGHVRDVEFSSTTRGLDPMFEGIKIVDCDTHFTEPADLWTANVPASMRGKMPHVRRVDNIDRWFVGEKD